MKLSMVISALLFAASPFTVTAQTMKPGLWEIKSQMQSDSGEMTDAMAQAQKEIQSMPAEQRKMVQDMMAKQGVQMDANAGGMIAKICMTQEMLNRNDMNAYQDSNKNDCTYSNSPRNGNSMKFSFVCKNPASKGSGQINFASSQAYNMKLDITTTENGKPERMQMQNSARWLGADCGNVKPIAIPMK